MEKRIAKVIFNKSGGTAKGTAVTNRVTIPTNWIKKMNISLDESNINRVVRLEFYGDKLKIEKEIIKLNKIESKDLRKMKYKDDEKEVSFALVIFNPSGGNATGNAITNRVTISTSWIKELGITEDDIQVKLTLENGKITIEKNVVICDK